MDKMLLYIGITVGGLIGSYIPVALFRSNPFGMASLIFGTIGSFAGLWAGYKAQQSFGE